MQDYSEKNNVDKNTKTSSHDNMTFEELKRKLVEQSKTIKNLKGEIENYKSSELRSKELLETMSDAYIVLDIVTSEDTGEISYVFSYVNKAFTEQVRRDKNDIIGKSFEDVLHIHDQSFHENFYNTINFDKPVIFEKYIEPIKKYLRIAHYSPFPDKIALLISDLTEHYNLISALKKSEQKFSAIANYTNDMESWLGTNGELLWISPSTEKITGYSLDELQDYYANLGTFLYPDDIEDIKTLVEDALFNKKKGFHSEFRFIRKDGAIIWLEMSHQPIFDESGNWMGLRSSGHDITARKKMELSLIESEKKYHSLFHSLRDGFSLMDIVQDDNGVVIDFIFREVNQAFLNLTGFKREEISNKKYTEIGFFRDCGFFEIAVEAAQNRKTVQLEKYCSQVDKHISVLHYFPQEGQLASIFSDIDERKRTEEALKISLEKYKVLFDSFPLGITVLDSEGNVIERNKETYRIFDLPQGYADNKHAIGKDWKVINREGKIVSDLAPLSFELLKKARFIKNWELNLVHSSGRSIWLSINIAPLNISDEGLIITFNDITDRIRAEEKLRQSEDRFRTVVEDQTNLICRHLADGTLTFSNSAFDQFFRIKSNQKHYSNLFKLNQPDTWNDYKEIISNFPKDKQVVNIEQKLIQPNGKLIWLTWTIRAIYDESGKTSVFQSVGQDVTHQKVIEEQEKRLIEKMQVIYRDLEDFSNLIHMDAREHPPLSLDELGISRHERNVIALVLRGMKNREIAEKIHVAESTVKKYLSEIYFKLSVKNRVELVNFIKDNQILI